QIIDTETFNQILELDEDEDSHDFSQPMVWDYFEQAEKTFITMDDAFAKEDLESLSSLGHFLKGSSAALGLSRVQHTCEQIQHVGNLRDEKSEKNLKPAEALKQMGKLLKRVKIEYKEAQVWMKDFYGESED
ncbi:signal transduction histidine kinase, partial [Gymnopilus junonius]